jgi:hypothetical protein
MRAWDPMSGKVFILKPFRRTLAQRNSGSSQERAPFAYMRAVNKRSGGQSVGRLMIDR